MYIQTGGSQKQCILSRHRLHIWWKSKRGKGMEYTYDLDWDFLLCILSNLLFLPFFMILILPTIFPSSSSFYSFFFIHHSFFLLFCFLIFLCIFFVPLSIFEYFNFVYSFFIWHVTYDMSPQIGMYSFSQASVVWSQIKIQCNGASFFV